jgi:predicted GIY-YIG superfamily endonuclease
MDIVKIKMLDGVVYKLKSKNPNITEFYIGSSCDMKQRITNHKNNCNNSIIPAYNFKVYEFIRNNGNFDNFEFEILLEVQVKSKKQLKNRYEAKYIIDFKPELNMKIPTTYDDETVEYDEEFYKPSYYEEHKEIILEKGNQYYKDHKEDLLKKRKEKYTCDCGSTIRKCDKTAHMKSKKHKTIYEEFRNNIKIVFKLLNIYLLKAFKKITIYLL